MGKNSWRIGHLEGLISPFANAGGIVKTVEDVERIAQANVGWIEGGSYTRECRYGNKYNPLTGELIIDPETKGEVKDYFYDEEKGETYSSLGMPNPGMDTVYKEIPEMSHIAHSYSKPLVINVAPVSEEPVEESVELVTRAYETGADAVILNGGCRNVISEEGERHVALCTNITETQLVLSALKSVTERFHPIWLRTPPQGSYVSAKDLFQ